MLHAQQVEELICMVSAMDREVLVRQFETYHASFPVDFTPEFLQREPVDRLRHIFVALCLQCQQLPELPVNSAA
jgi:hypothetical protein